MNFAQAQKFVKTSGFCLRYGANDSLPIPSLYQEVMGDTKKPSKDELRPAIEITNLLLEKHEVVEVNVVADRLCLVHRDLVPSLYCLVLASKRAPLSKDAKAVLELLEEKGEIASGDVRKLLGIASVKSGEDPAYTILSELQSHLLVDRGPFKISNTGIPYLSREGYPYRLLAEAHPELVKEGEALKFDEAARAWVSGYLKRFKKNDRPTPRKMASLFKRFLTPDQVGVALENLNC